MLSFSRGNMWYPNGDGDGDGNRIFTYLYIYHIFPISTGDISLLPIFHPSKRWERNLTEHPNGPRYFGCPKRWLLHPKASPQGYL